MPISMPHSDTQIGLLMPSHCAYPQEYERGRFRGQPRFLLSGQKRKSMTSACPHAITSWHLQQHHNCGKKRDGTLPGSSRSP